MEGLKGIRNPAAREPKVLAQLAESDAINLLAQMSYLHRQLDRCEVPGRVTARFSVGRGIDFFAPSGGAQRLKAKYRRSMTSCTSEMAQVVSNSYDVCHLYV